AAARGVDVFESLIAEDVAARREGCVADHQQHRLRVATERGRLGVEALAQRYRRIEDRLRRRAPLVDRALHVLEMPDAAPGESRHVVVGELLPALRTIQ